MNIACIIPSKNPQNLAVSVGAVKTLDPSVRIIIVDDGLGALKTDCTVVPGIKPFVFSRNVNMGIKAAGEVDGVVILNDDAVLKTAGGFTTLANTAALRPEYGLIASTTNNVGNRNQLLKDVGLRDEPRMVCFICTYIPRSTLDVVGLLDERFTAYGFDDDDYCLRARRAGLKIGIHDGCFVDHASLKSSFRSETHADLGAGARIFREKWGADNHAL